MSVHIFAIYSCTTKWYINELKKKKKVAPPMISLYTVTPYTHRMNRKPCDVTKTFFLSRSYKFIYNRCLL